MCIALISTAHPSYPLIIIDNRDEYLRRPTSPADWWPTPQSHILSGRDLARATHGTWMGVTKDGRIAVLTNYRENTSDQVVGAQSRGAITNSWLGVAPESRPKTREFVHEMVASATARNVGGFSLVCGYMGEPLAIVSNRSANMDQIGWVAGEGEQKTLGLSNTCFDDRSWPKILDGERLVEEAIGEHVKAGEDEDGLITRLLGVLSRDTLPKLDADATAEDYLPHFRKSIFIPALGPRGEVAKTEERVQGDQIDHSFLHGPYGTQQQTVVLVSADGRVRYFERTLYDSDTRAIPTGEGDRSFEYQIEQA